MRSVSFYFFPRKEGLYALKQESEKIMLLGFFFRFSCTQDNTADASKSIMSEQQILALRRINLDLLATTRVTTCTYTQLNKN